MTEKTLQDLLNLFPAWSIAILYMAFVPMASQVPKIVFVRVVSCQLSVQCTPHNEDRGVRTANYYEHTTICLGRPSPAPGPVFFSSDLESQVVQVLQY